MNLSCINNLLMQINIISSINAIRMFFYNFAFLSQNKFYVYNFVRKMIMMKAKIFFPLPSITTIVAFKSLINLLTKQTKQNNTCSTLQS